jgi:hypothetical protein
MSAFLAALAVTFGVILLVELADKTLIATLVLSTRYRLRHVLAGVTAAFAVQCVVAVAAGHLVHLLPRRAVEAVVAGLFALGAALLVRESLSEPGEIALDEARQNVPTRRAVLTSFGVLFAANGATPARSRSPAWLRVSADLSRWASERGWRSSWWLRLRSLPDVSSSSVCRCGSSIASPAPCSPSSPCWPLWRRRSAEHLPRLRATMLCKLCRLTGFPANTCIVMTIERRVRS